jgi:hypothetical protein
MKKGDIYVCEECGLELKVVKECQDVDTQAEECNDCCGSESSCALTCCGMEMVQK